MTTSASVKCRARHLLGQRAGNREDFGISWNVALEAGGVLVSKDVKIAIEIETVLRVADDPS